MLNSLCTPSPPITLMRSFTNWRSTPQRLKPSLSPLPALSTSSLIYPSLRMAPHSLEQWWWTISSPDTDTWRCPTYKSVKVGSLHIPRWHLMDSKEACEYIWVIIVDRWWYLISVCKALGWVFLQAVSLFLWLCLVTVRLSWRWPRPCVLPSKTEPPSPTQEPLSNWTSTWPLMEPSTVTQR